MFNFKKTYRRHKAVGLAVQSRRRRNLLFKLVSLSFPIILLLALEGILALRFHAQYSNSSLSVQGQYRFVAAPYRGYANNPTYVRMHDGVTYRYNNYGFRDEEDLGPKGQNEFRVFVMGGSAAYGSEVRELGSYREISGEKAYPSSRTIAGQLQEFLQEGMPHRKVRVINAAVVSYEIAQNYVMYLSLIRYLAPDLIVTMDGWNEDFNETNPMRDLPTVEALSGGPLVQMLRRNSYTMYYLGFLVFDLNVMLRTTPIDQAEFAAMDIEQVRNDFRKELTASKPDNQALDGIMIIYEQFWHAAKLDDVPILFTVQPVPTLDQKKKLSREEVLLLKYESRYGRHKIGVAHLADRLTARAAKDPDFHALSLLSVFEDFSEMAYVDYAHLSPGANRHLAEKLADYILAQPNWTNHRRPPAVAKAPRSSSEPR
jgi:hypothetical protein